MSRLWACVAAIAGLAVVLVGCGGDDSSTSVRAEALAEIDREIVSECISEGNNFTSCECALGAVHEYASDDELLDAAIPGGDVLAETLEDLLGRDGAEAVEMCLADENPSVGDNSSDDSSGGDDSGGGSGEPLTQEEFIAAADAICTEADQKSDALGEPESLDDATQLLRDGVAIFEEQLDALSELTPPEELSASMDRALELLGQVNDSINEAADTFENGDLAEAEEILNGLDPVSEELDQIAADIGLEACGSDTALG